jgi:hypothetical protein
VLKNRLTLLLGSLVAPALCRASSIIYSVSIGKSSVDDLKTGLPEESSGLVFVYPGLARDKVARHCLKGMPVAAIKSRPDPITIVEHA